METAIQTISNQEGRMTSLMLAELSGKQHKNIMRDIRNMEDAWEEVNGLKFELVEYTDSKGEKRPCYNLTKTETLYVATKWDDKSRAKLILRWQELELAEKKRLPGSFREALLLAAAQQEEIEKQNLLLEAKDSFISEQASTIHEQSKELTELKERTKYFDIIMASKALMTTSQIAMDYGMSAKAFNKMLAEYRIQYKQNGQWLLKYPYTAEGYVFSKTILLDNGTTILNTQWTQKGRLFLYKFLKRKGVLPTIEREDVEK